MKTVWILNHHAVTPELGGGTRHYDFAKELLNRGYKVYIFASSYIHNKYVNVLSKQESFKQIDVEGINWIWINTKEYKGNGKNRIIGMMQYYFFMMKNYKRFPKPDYIIGSAVHLLACTAGYHISRRLGSMSICEIRDLWPETLIELGSLKRGSIVARAMRWLEGYVYKKSNHIIVTAPGMIDYIEKVGICRDKITYLNNGVSIKDYEERLAVTLSTEITQHLRNQKFNVVYLGSIGVANAMDTLVEAAYILKDSPEIQFTFIGDGPQKNNLKDNATKKGIESIKFFDSISKQSVPGVLACADCLVFSAKNSPIYKYGISANKLFDYMYSAKPVIFAINAVNDFIKESGCGISIPPEDANELANAIFKIYSMNKEERKQMGEKGRAFVQENFDIPILVDKLEEVFNSSSIK